VLRWKASIAVRLERAEVGYNNVKDLLDHKIFGKQ
jgi:hypothetical protein